VRFAERRESLAAHLHVGRIRSLGQRDEDLAEQFPWLDRRDVAILQQFDRVDHRPAEPGAHLVLE
jgi:hypothetical protein